MKKPLIRLMVLVGSMCWLLPSAGAQDAYQRAFAEATELEGQGRFAEAAARLAPLYEAYPQDYALALQLGWLSFQAEQYALAEGYYAQAMALSNGSRDAQLGLGWSLLRQGRHSDAAAAFRQVLAQHPDDESALEGLALAEAERVPVFRAWVWPIYHYYTDNPDVSSGWSFAAGASGVAWDHLYLSAAYRFDRYAFDSLQAVQNGLLAPGPGPGPGPEPEPEPQLEPEAAPGPGPDGTTRRASTSTIDQHEVYGSVGVTFPAFDVVARYAGLLSSDDVLEEVHVAGLSGRYSPFGDITVDLTASFHPDWMVWRVAPGWRIPLGAGFWVRPGLSLQVIDGDALWAGNLTVAYERARGAIWLGGRGGREARVADLTVPAVYNLRGDIRFGGWIGGRVNFGSWTIFSGYELAGVEITNGSTTSTSLASWVGLGIAAGI